VRDLKLVSELVKASDSSLIVKDDEGNYHFGGQIHNVKDVSRALESLKEKYPEFVQNDAQRIKDLFENTFHHSEFTGRSGTFFAYEGLGSIYWHMVSKLLLAVQETILRTRGEPSTEALIEKYNDIRKGLSFNKSPEAYGAFPTDPYSHTPKGQGAKQPGMTGMVKEEILTRQMELGFAIQNGCIVFDFLLLDEDEFVAESTEFTYLNVHGKQGQVRLHAGSIAFTICQVPVTLEAAEEPCIQVYFSTGESQEIKGSVLDSLNSKHIFQRDGFVDKLVVSVQLD
jgi:hypothetical protein